MIYSDRSVCKMLSSVYFTYQVTPSILDGGMDLMSKSMPSCQVLHGDLISEDGAIELMIIVRVLYM